MHDQAAEAYRLSPLQHHHWRVRRRFPGREWSATVTVRVEGPVDADRLRAALEEVARRHEILRTGFPLLPGTSVPVQSIGDDPELSFEVHDLSELAAGECALWLEEKERALAAEPFQLERTGGVGLLRAVLITLAPEEHRLLLAQPTIAADAESLWNLVRETTAVLRGEPSASSGDDGDGAMQFADVAEWFHQNFESEDAAQGLAFWRQVDPKEALELRIPQALEATLDGTFEPAALTRRLSDEDQDAIERLARRCGAAPEAVLLAAWQTLLARLSERAEPVVGVHSTGRGFEGLEDALGPFARLLPVRMRVDGSFAELVRRANTACGAAEEWHELFDFERAGASAEGFLPYAFEYLAPPAPERAGDLAFVLERRHAVTEPFHLALVHDVVDGAPALALRYDPRVFLTADVECLLDQVATLVANGCADPDARADALSALSAEARGRVIEEFAHGPAPANEPACVHRLIAEHAAQTPAAPAVFAAGQELTYGELDRRANQLARHLRALGVGPDVFVGLYLDRSVEMLVGLLATLKAGGAYLPLPPGYPSERVAFMLVDAAAPVVLTRTREAESLPPFAGAVVKLDAERREIESLDDEPLDELAGPENRAYVIHTSGSTGKPKGVPILHRNLAHSTRTRMEYYEDSVRTYLLLSSFAFDSSVAGIFWTLCQGGRLLLPEDGFEQEIPAIADLIEEHGVTHMLALPSLYGLILDTTSPERLRSLSTVIVAGESSSRALVAAHAEKLPSAGLYNEYGPTEGTVWSTVFDCSVPFDRTRVPIGRPVPGAEAYVVDPEGEPAPIGAPGELWIGGTGIAPGYLDRPELTAERFVADPFHPGEGRRLYRTGDVARWLPDGNLEFLGRLDHQVKLRGYRIELEEIEAALSTHAAVRETVLLAREDTPGDQRLVAYVATTGEDPAAPAELRAHVAASLPDYMIPAHFVFLDELPLLPNGKVDRRALPAPDHGRAEATSAYVAPATPLEQVLAAIWSELLKVDQVGTGDDFFELGGHSILATQLFARIVDTFQVKIRLRLIFDRRTIRALAEDMLRNPAERHRIERTAEIVLSVLETPDEALGGQ